MAQHKQSGQGGQGGQQIEQYFKGVDFPCKTNDLERVAQKNDAPRNVLENIRQMPDRQYNSLSEVRSAIGVETTTR